MKENLKNQSDLLYTQAKQQFDAIKQAYEHGDLGTEVAVIQAAFEAFQNFFSTLGQQRFEAIEFDDSTPMWSEDYNGMMQDIYDDFEVLFREATLLADAMYVDFNHHVVQHDILSEKLKSIQNKMYDLAAYNSIEGYTTNVYAKEEFLNQERIDYDKITMSPLTIEGGNVTLPQTSKKNALENATATILLGTRESTLSPVGALSNGYPGNNHEIVTSTKDYDRTGKSLSLNFIGSSNNRANYGAVLDGNPNTWFEFEKIVPTRLVNSVSEKDYGFSYKTAYDHYHYWTNPLEDGVLKLCLEINLDGMKVINAIDISMYTPANRLAKIAKVARILIIDENNNSINVAYNHTGTFYKFDAIKARAVQLFFEQEHAYVTEIGHIFYTKKYLAEDSNGYKHSVVNRIAEANNRVDGPIPWITDIGAIIEEDVTRSEVLYAPRMSEGNDSSVDSILSNLRSQIGMEDVEMGVERIQADRYCIGIKDINIYEVEFEEEGELITKPFYFENPLERISLNIDEADSLNANWLSYSISIDDGITWHPITPMHRQEEGVKTYIIQQVERSSGIIQKEGIIETEHPVYSMRIRVIGKIGEVQQKSDPIRIATQTPVLRTIEIQGTTRTTDDVLTYVSEERDKFTELEEPPIPPIKIDPDPDPEPDPKPGPWPEPIPCKICNDEDEDEDDLNNEDEPENKMISILKSDKSRVCLDSIDTSRMQVKITYGAVTQEQFPITYFRVEFDKFPHLNETITLTPEDNVKKISKDVIIDLSLLEDGDELIVKTFARNTDGFEIYDEISVEVVEDCSFEWAPSSEDKSRIQIDPRVVIGRVCEHTFHESGELNFVAYVRSYQSIVKYEIYENNEVVDSRVFSELDNIYQMDISHNVTKELYSLEEKTPSPYVIVYDAFGKKKKKTFKVALRDCLGKGKKEFLYAEFSGKSTEYCVDETFVHDWKAGSSRRIKQVRMWMNNNEIYNKIYPLTSKKVRASGQLRIPYNQLQAGDTKLKIELTDITGQVITGSKDLTFVSGCSSNDSRRKDRIMIKGKTDKNSYCPCGEDILITGSIEAKPGLERVIFKLGDIAFEPSSLNPLSTMNEDACEGGYQPPPTPPTPPVNPPVDPPNNETIDLGEVVAQLEDLNDPDLYKDIYLENVTTYTLCKDKLEELNFDAVIIPLIGIETVSSVIVSLYDPSKPLDEAFAELKIKANKTKAFRVKNVGKLIVEALAKNNVSLKVGKVRFTILAVTSISENGAPGGFSLTGSETEFQINACGVIDPPVDPPVNPPIIHGIDEIYTYDPAFLEICTTDRELFNARFYGDTSRALTSYTVNVMKDGVNYVQNKITMNPTNFAGGYVSGADNSFDDTITPTRIKPGTYEVAMGFKYADGGIVSLNVIRVVKECSGTNPPKQEVPVAGYITIDDAHMSAIERLEMMAESGALNTEITQADLDFIQSIEEFEIDENCGCRKKKGTKQALRAMNTNATSNAIPMAFLEDISPVIKKISDELYSYEFSLPYWFIYELGFWNIDKTYSLTIEGITTNEKTYKRSIPIKIDACSEPIPEDQGPEDTDPDDPKDPKPPVENPDEDCKGDVIQAINMTYYDFAKNTFINKRFSMLKGKESATQRTLTDTFKNKIRVGINKPEKRVWVQNISKGEYPGFMIAQMFVEVGQPDLSTSTKYYFDTGETYGEAENIENLIYAKEDIDFNTHYLYDDLRNLGDASEAPKLVQTNSYFNLFGESIPWDTMCPQEHLKHKQKDLEENPDEGEEPEPELNCKDHKMVHIQYYDDVDRKLRDVFFNLVEGKGEPREIQARNGSGTMIEVLAGYSGVSKGPALSISKADEDDDMFFYVTAIGIGYSQQEGGISFHYAESVRYSTRTHEGQENMLGEPKELSQLTWVSNGVIDKAKAPWVGGHRDMISSTITLPENPCNPNDNTWDDLFPVPPEEIINIEKLKENGVITFQSYVTPVYNTNIAIGEIEVVKGRFAIRRTYKSFRECRFYITYTFQNGNSVIERHPGFDYNGSLFDVKGSGYVTRDIIFEFRNLDHYGYGKVVKAEMFVELLDHDSSTYTKYPKYSIEIPVERGNRNETMKFAMVANSASVFLDSICVNRAIATTYTFEANYRVFDAGFEIEKFGIQIRSSREIIGEAYRTYGAGTKIVNDQFPVLIARTDIFNKNETHYYAVPMVQFKGSNVPIPISHYQLALRTLNCV